MILRKAGNNTEPRVLPGEDVSLQSSSKGARVRFSGGIPAVVDAPFTDTEELAAGFTMVDVASKEDAIEWVKRWPALNHEGEVEIEVREGGCPGGVVGVRGSRSPGNPAAGMRFAILLKSDRKMEDGFVADEARLAAMTKRNDEAAAAGVMLAGEGLQPSSKGARVKFSGGKTAVIDGPFAEAKELIAGFWLIHVKSKDEAIEWVKRYPYPTEEAEIEIRQVF